MGVFEKALKETLGFEGGFSDDPVDPGGATHWGITQETARKHGYQGEMKDFKMSMAMEIYKTDYWDKNKLDQVAKYDEKIAIEMFDTGVNMGVRQAGKFLQRAINCLNRNQNLFPNLKVDGIIGSKTLATLSFLGKEIDKKTMLAMLNALQGARYIEICEKDNKMEKFVRGWFRRVSFT